MTKISAIAASVLFTLIMLAFVFGLSGGGAATPMLAAILCGVPLMMLFVGMAIGSGFKNYRLVPVEKLNKTRKPRVPSALS